MEELMDIIITGYWLDGTGDFEGYLCKIGECPENEDENYFFYFDNTEDVAGAHLDFVVTDWSEA
jgi:hypothetical protein